MVKSKTRLGYPPLILPVCLVGANVAGRPNFEAIAWFNLVDYQPAMIGLSSEKSHYTNRGIRENKSFSVNVPSADMAAVTDFCGLYSGSKVDKSKVFEVFYGELKTAPMISECPFNIECKLAQTVELLHGEFFIGEIVGLYMDDRYLTDSKPDLKKINPLLFEGSAGSYWKLGEYLARVSEPGKNFRPRTERKE